jgi:hypothetical protein
MDDRKAGMALDLEAELAMLDLENAMFDMNETGRELDELWEKFRAGNVPLVPHELAPLTIEALLCLPEFGGKMTENSEFWKKGDLNDKQIRTAIKKGLLTPLPLGGKTYYLNRKQIAELLQPCQDHKPRQDSGSARPAAKKAGSPARGRGLSSMEESRSALDAALRIAQELKDS